jgi:hypothetical protein
MLSHITSAAVRQGGFVCHEEVLRRGTSFRVRVPRCVLDGAGLIGPLVYGENKDVYGVLYWRSINSEPNFFRAIGIGLHN